MFAITLIWNHNRQNSWHFFFSPHYAIKAHFKCTTNYGNAQENEEKKKERKKNWKSSVRHVESVVKWAYCLWNMHKTWYLLGCCCCCWRQRIRRREITNVFNINWPIWFHGEYMLIFGTFSVLCCAHLSNIRYNQSGMRSYLRPQFSTGFHTHSMCKNMKCYEKVNNFVRKNRYIIEFDFTVLKFKTSILICFLIFFYLCRCVCVCFFFIAIFQFSIQIPSKWWSFACCSTSTSSCSIGRCSSRSIQCTTEKLRFG